MMKKTIALALCAASAASFALPAALADDLFSQENQEKMKVEEAKPRDWTISQRQVAMPNLQDSILYTDMEGLGTIEEVYAQNKQQQQQPEQAAGEAAVAPLPVPVAATTDPKAKAELGPHAVAIDASLASALDQVHGIQKTYDVSGTPATPSKESLAVIRDQSKSLNMDIKDAQKHQKMMKTEVKKGFPQVAQTDQYQTAQLAYNDLNTMNTNWQSKAKGSSYFKDSEQVKSDLDAFEKQINDTIKATQSLGVTG